MQITNLNDRYPSQATPSATPSGRAPQPGAAGSTMPAPVGPAGPAPRVDQNAVKEALEAANRAMVSRGSQVEFSFDKDSGRTLVRVVDTETKKVLRQFPSEEMIAIARNIDKMRGTNVEDVV